MIKKEVAVIVPDYAAGKAFSGVLRNKGVEPILYDFKISPRIVVDEEARSRLTKKPYDIALELASGIQEIVRQTPHSLVTISCNTLSLDKFILPMKGMLHMNGFKEDEDYILYTTLDALSDSGVRDNPNNVFLGTNGIVEELSSGKFTTLLDFGYANIQELVQELTWRVKGVTGADISSAPNYLVCLKNRDELDRKIKLLTFDLKDKEINEVILGCTELPIAFKRAKKLGLQTANLIDPAYIVAEKIIQL